MSDHLIPTTPLCGRCRSPIDTTDRYCRQCGAATSGGGGSGPKWWDNVWFILALLLAIAGPLAFPLLWRSRQFNRFGKVALTILVLALTVAACWWAWIVVEQQWARLQAVLKF